MDTVAPDAQRAARRGGEPRTATTLHRVYPITNGVRTIINMESADTADAAPVASGSGRNTTEGI